MKYLFLLFLFIYTHFLLFAQVSRGLTSKAFSFEDKKSGYYVNGIHKYVKFLDRTNINITNVLDIGNIINDYTPVLSLNSCNSLIVQDGSAYHVGDTVLLIQMKGAVIDSTNSVAFGTITDYKNAGNYEFNYVKARVGNSIELKNTLLKQYDLPAGKVQLIRVPYYTSVNVSSTLTCLPWDGSKGGVLVFNVRDNLTLSSDIDVKGKGFRGGIISNNPDGACGTSSPNYYYPLTQPGISWNSGGAEKGEGITILSDQKMAGKGCLANGGGGGNKHNTGGGGGGGNYGTGGKGGNELSGCAVTANGGLGGKAMVAAYNTNKIFLGGGGGRGDDNNHVGTVGEKGGGIVIITANTIISNSHVINAEGSSQLIAGGDIADGAGGGGAGGTVLLNIPNYNGNLSIDVKGGAGGNQLATYGCVGTGGGGGGGVVIFSLPAQPPVTNILSTGGVAGVFQTIGYSCTNGTYGAANGNDGAVLFNLQLPASTVPHSSLDSLRFDDSRTTCRTLTFSGIAYPSTSLINNWQWNFGDGGHAYTQNVNHDYSANGSFNVQLIVWDLNGCKDSIARSIIVDRPIFTAPENKSICANGSVQLDGSNGTTFQYLWSPATHLSNPGIVNPIASPTVTTTYTLLVTDHVCNYDSTFSVRVTVNNLPIVKATSSNDLDCSKSISQLTASDAIQYDWTLNTSLSNTSIYNPVASPNITTRYTVTGKDNNGCSNTATVTVYIKGGKYFGFNIPNSFTPNDDGLNDCFGVTWWSETKNFHLVIYRRWGEKVFETNKVSECWSGNYNGQRADAGNYVYYLTGETLCGNVTRKGNVLLIR